MSRAGQLQNADVALARAGALAQEQGNDLAVILARGAGSVLRAHPNGAQAALSPRPEQYAERAAALAEADVLEGRDLVDRGDDQGGAGQSTACPVPRESVPQGRRHCGADGVGDEAGSGPGEEVAGGEQPGTQRPALLRRARVERRRRRDRREHHRGHHDDPDPEEPAQASQARPRPRVHAPHLARRPHPADSRDGEQRRDQAESQTSSGVRGRETGVRAATR